MYISLFLKEIKRNGLFSGDKTWWREGRHNLKSHIFLYLHFIQTYFILYTKVFYFFFVVVVITIISKAQTGLLTEIAVLPHPTL